MKTISTFLSFLQVKKEILKVAPLEVDQGDPHAGRLRVLMMYDMYISFFLQKKRKCFLDNLVLLFHVQLFVLGVTLDHVETLTKTSLEFT